MCMEAVHVCLIQTDAYRQQQEHTALLTSSCILCNFSMVLNTGSHAAASLPGGTSMLNNGGNSGQSTLGKM